MSVNALPRAVLEFGAVWTKLWCLGTKRRTYLGFSCSSSCHSALRYMHLQFMTLSLLQVTESFVCIGSVGTSRTYSFLHLSIQELLAAWHISKMPHEEQLDLVRDSHRQFGEVFQELLPAGSSSIARVGRIHSTTFPRNMPPAHQSCRCWVSYSFQSHPGHS